MLNRKIFQLSILSLVLLNLSQMAYAADAHREALIATAVVLFVFILIINGMFLIVKRRGAN